MNEFDGLSKAEITAKVSVVLDEASEAIAELFPRMHKRPLLGGVFGSAGFQLCSYCYTFNRLQEVHYYVMSEHGLFLGYGHHKADAIQMARSLLGTIDVHEKTALLAKYRVKVEAREAEVKRLIAVADSEAIARASRSGKVRSIPRRRQQIFDESGGKCHYCETVLTLDGKWHIEHKMPKALMGGNEPGNLVASCVTCNHRKKDKTDVEFKAQLVRESFSPSPAKESEKV